MIKNSVSLVIPVQAPTQCTYPEIIPLIFIDLPHRFITQAILIFLIVFKMGEGAIAVIIHISEVITYPEIIILINIQTENDLSTDTVIISGLMIIAGKCV